MPPSHGKSNYEIYRCTKAVVSSRRHLLCLYVLILCISSFYTCCTRPANAQHKALTAREKSEKQKSGIVSHLTNWRRVSGAAGKLIDNRKYYEAENMLNSILPQAKKEASRSLDYALVLCRLGTDLYALKKYPQALTQLNEAMAILSCNPPSIRQREIMWLSKGNKAAVLLSIHKNVEAEALARKVIASAVAFPYVCSNSQFKIAYLLLDNSLVAQKKSEEAKKVSQVMSRL